MKVPRAKFAPPNCRRKLQEFRRKLLITGTNRIQLFQPGTKILRRVTGANRQNRPCQLRKQPCTGRNFVLLFNKWPCSDRLGCRNCAESSLFCDNPYNFYQRGGKEVLLLMKTL